MQGFQALVETVKRVQRHNLEARDIWHKLCDEHFKGMRDPSRLSPAFLNQFLSSLPQDNSAPLSNGSGVRPVATKEEGQRKVLVQKVEALLEVPKLKKAWERSCDRDCGGEMDPSKLDVAFLQRFLVKHDDGTHRPAPVPQATSSPASAALSKPRVPGLASVEQVERVKKAQRSSQHWRDVWQTLCDDERNGMRDPSQLSEEFVQRFLERVEAEDPAALRERTPRGSGEASANRWDATASDGASVQEDIGLHANNKTQDRFSGAWFDDAWAADPCGAVWGAAPWTNGKASSSSSAWGQGCSAAWLSNSPPSLWQWGPWSSGWTGDASQPWTGDSTGAGANGAAWCGGPVWGEGNGGTCGDGSTWGVAAWREGQDLNQSFPPSKRIRSGDLAYETAVTNGDGGV